MRADQAVNYALEHMPDRDVVFVSHGHFSRSMVTRWVEQPCAREPGSDSAPLRRRCAVSNTDCANCRRWA